MKGVVGIGGKKRVVDQSCNVRFICPKCRGQEVRDAYAGPAWHVACGAWMLPMSLIVSDEVKPFLLPVGMSEDALPDPNRGL